LNWTPHPNIAISTAFQFEDFEREFTPGRGNDTDPQRIKTYSAPLSVSYFSPTGFFGKIGATYVDQKTKFVTDNKTGVLLDTFKDNFWVIDASLGYRFPKRYGQIKIGVSNLLDQDFRYQSAGIDTQLPQRSTYQPERTVYMSFNMSFL
jgi:outer membrane receptor protein involved in Fe transport